MTDDNFLDHQVLNFGKYEGSRVCDIVDEDPGYVVYLYEQCDNAPNMSGKWCSTTLYRCCADDAIEQSGLTELDFTERD